MLCITDLEDKYLNMVYAFERQIGIWIRPTNNTIYADVVKKKFKIQLKEAKLSLIKKTLISQSIRAIEENKSFLKYKDYHGRIEYEEIFTKIKTRDLCNVDFLHAIASVEESDAQTI
ncbi:hypothetical protein EB796_014343 [Bugula neritina]|uniref:Uncharacterized protein n=1 Tax=Bugula neritina TaxID=10212 RepID=A0A7J7JMS6_BUGNE|nr:hypothetical protein EB796_014343 [Bugula neritina]